VAGAGTRDAARDTAANQVTSLLRYEKWRDGGLVATEPQRFRLQYWSLPEFGQLLADAGFTDVTVTGSWSNRHSGTTSPAARCREGRSPEPRGTSG
jgi:hypothetical protein